MSSYDLILKKEDKKIVLEYASIEGKRGKPLGIASHELLDDKQTKIVFDDEKNTTLLIPPGKDGYTPQKGVDYFDGKDGISPTIETKNEDDGYLVTLTDLKGKKEFKLLHGEKGEKGDPGDTGEPSKVVKTAYDSEGNTLISFNDGTTSKINRGKTGPKGDKGDSTTTTSITKSGLTTTVKFTDGKSMKIEDGKSVNVSSYKILDDGNTEISFSDGKKAIVKKGQDGTVKFDELTEEQVNMLKVEVVDDLKTGGSDKALSAEQGKVLFNTILKYHTPKVMTAVIDQTNSNPLTCITYEDDAKMMEKGSPEWDDFFQSQLVLFKDGKEVRELEDSELNDLKPEDGDVMVRFPRKGLRIKTVGEKVYVSMTDNIDDPDFKYYAHTRGNQRKYNFYLGAYLGFEENGKLRSITGKAPTGNKTIGSFRTIAQANGAGYEQLAFYQWTFLQAMYVLKYGNLDSQTALGKGNTFGNNYDKATGETNGKGVDFGSTSSTTKVRFQWVEDFFGTKYQWCDGVKTNNNKIWINNDNFNDTGNGYKSYEGYDVYEQHRIKSVIGDSERGFIPKSDNGSSSTYYCDYAHIKPADNRVARVGGDAGNGANAGAFFFYANCSASFSYSSFGARLMFL